MRSAGRRINDKFPAGVVTLRSDFAREHKEEMIRLARRQEEAEKQEHPLNRIELANGTDKTVPRQAGVYVTDRRRSTEPESAPRGGQAIRRAGTRIDPKPFHRPRILPELLRQDRRGGIRGIMAPGAQAQIHRSCRSREPNTRKRDGSCRGDRDQGLALGRLERYRIDDHRIPSGERLGSLPAQRPIDATRYLRRIGARRQPRFGGNSE
jgi:hypothetical protein